MNSKSEEALRKQIIEELIQEDQKVKATRRGPPEPKKDEMLVYTNYA